MRSRVLAGVSLLGRSLRGVLLVSLSLASIATGLAGAWTVAGVSRFWEDVPNYFPQPELHGPIRTFVDTNICQVVVFLNRYHDESVALTGSRGVLRFQLHYKLNPAVAGNPDSASLGPVEFGHDSGTYVACSCGNPLELRTWQTLDAENIHSHFYDATYWISVPYWLPAPLFAACPLLAFYRGPWRRRRRKAKGFCIRCGYDLTGNVTGVCSECGTALR